VSCPRRSLTSQLWKSRDQALNVLDILDFGAIGDAEADHLDFLRECRRGTAFHEDVVGSSLVVFVVSEILLVANTEGWRSTVTNSISQSWDTNCYYLLVKQSRQGNDQRI
jgi:hypothetical protein